MPDHATQPAAPGPRPRRWLLAVGAVAVAVAGLVYVFAGSTGDDKDAGDEGPLEGAETPTPAVTPTTIPIDEFGYQWQSRPIGGGGWVTGLEISTGGELVLARTDVGGVFRWDETESRWFPALSADGVERPEAADYQVEAIAIAPTNPAVVYASAGFKASTIDGRILRSADGGQTWQASEQHFGIAGNAANRQGGERLSVSPVDENRVWLATRTEGLFTSEDGAKTWTNLAAVPNGPTPPEDEVGDDDPQGQLWVIATVEEGSEIVYVAVAADGVYRGDVAADTWERVVETDGIAFDGELDASGRLWVTDVGASTIVRYDPASGDVLDLETGLTGGVRVVATHSTDPDIIVVMNDQAASRTTSGGASWDRLDVFFSCEALPWLDETDIVFLSASSPEFDPVNTNGMWFPQGWGTWYGDALADEDALRLTCRNIGIEELVTNDIVVPVSGEPVSAHWDVPLFHHGPGEESGATRGPSDRFNSAWDLDTLAADPRTVVAVVADARFCCESDGLAYQSGISRDGGLTWTPFESYANGDHPFELRFGNIAISADDPTNIVWLPTFNAAMHRTVDGGATWEPVILPGTADITGEEGQYAGGSHTQHFLARQVLVADPVNGDRFYLYHQDLGLFGSNDAGATWEVVSDDSLPTGWPVGWFNARLLAVPGEEGHLYFSPGTFEEETSFPLYESNDGGVSWQIVEGATDVEAMGTGSSVEPGGPPTLFIAGEIDGERGIWRTPTSAADWTQVADAPEGNYSIIKSVTGDPEVPGRVYVGFSGNGIVQGDDANLP